MAQITEAAMRGEIKDFSESLRRRVALLAGAPAAALERVYAEKLRLNPGAERLLASVQAAGIQTLLVSGGFTFFTERLRERLGLDHAHANTLEVDADGKLTGRVLGDILDGDAKAAHLAALAQRLSAVPSRSSPSATAPTTSRCWPAPASPSPTTPSPSCASKRPTP